jgi:D-sedoheptulose 7-phosphate isomerase
MAHSILYEATPRRQADAAAEHLRATSAAHAELSTASLPAVLEAASLLLTAFSSGQKLLICGNGGSAADCQHIAAELVGSLTRRRRPALPAIALTTDTSILTGYANDYGYEEVFARQVDAYGSDGDVLLAISTSGSSVNVLRAVDAATARGLYTVALVGAAEGPLADRVDVRIRIPSTNTQIIQECMLAVEHILCEVVEDALFSQTGMQRWRP